MSSELDLFWHFVDEVCEKYDVVMSEINTWQAEYYAKGRICISIRFDLTLQCIHYWDSIVEDIKSYNVLLGLNLVLFIVN